MGQRLQGQGHEDPLQLTAGERPDALVEQGLAVDAGQMEAARSLGMTHWQAMRKVVFPQGIKNAIPALTNELIINIKDSSVLSVIGVFDLMYATTTVAGVYYRQMEVYCVALVVYLILTLVASRLLEAFGKKLKAAGNRVEVHRIAGAFHGYFALGIKFLHVQESFEYMNRFLEKEEQE